MVFICRTFALMGGQGRRGVPRGNRTRRRRTLIGHPGSNVAHWLVAELFDGPTDFQLLAVQHFYAVAAVTGLVVLSRRVGASPWATAAAVMIVGAQSWFFWIAPLGPDIAATTWFCVWAVPYVCDRRVPDRRGWWAGLAAGIWGWHTIAAVGVISAVAAVTHHRRGRVGWGWAWPAAGAVCAAAGTAVWALAVDAGGLVTHTRRQIGVPDITDTASVMFEHVTAWDFTGFLTVAAVPLWIGGLWVGRRSTRIVVAGTVGSVIMLAAVMSVNARSQSHWPHLFVVPTVVGAAVTGTWLWSLAAPGLRKLRIDSSVPLAVAAVLGVVAISGPAVQADISVYRYMAAAAEAGDVAVANPPAGTQEWAWTSADLNRWLAYYWHLPPAPAIPDAVPDNDVAVMQLRNLPSGRPGGWQAVPGRQLTADPDLAPLPQQWTFAEPFTGHVADPTIRTATRKPARCWLWETAHPTVHNRQQAPTECLTTPGRTP